jgi:maleylacetate reductase
MRVAGSHQYRTMESVTYGKPAAAALREEAERLGAKRVYLIASRTLNTTTDEIEKIRKALGERLAATFDGVPQHTTRDVVTQIARQASEAKADLVVAIGGGSVVDAAKVVLMCMEHEIFEPAGLDGFETTPGASIRGVPDPNALDLRERTRSRSASPPTSSRSSSWPLEAVAASGA